jgi:hypothetical protein
MKKLTDIRVIGSNMILFLIALLVWLAHIPGPYRTVLKAASFILLVLYLFFLLGGFGSRIMERRKNRNIT